MKKITDIAGNELTQALSQIAKVVPVGTNILLELLTPQEILGTKLHLANDTKTLNGAPQAYVLALGPKVDKDWGICVGDRVVLSGNFVPLPEAVSHNGRPQACVEPHCIKAVLAENRSVLPAIVPV